MVKICSSCGTRMADDQSLFCNKCGYPFPQTQPKRTEVPQQREPPVSRVPANTSGRMHRNVQTSGKRPGVKNTGRSGLLPFKTLIGRDYLKLIYIVGAALIILVSLMGISAGFSKTETGAANASFTNTTALLKDPPSSPLFWIGFLILGNLIWRIFCELAAIIFLIYDIIRTGGETIPDDDERPEYDEEGIAGYDDKENGEIVKCPYCSKIVPLDQLRGCDVCGVQGCRNCIRIMGLLKKKMTCKDCFDNK